MENVPFIDDKHDYLPIKNCDFPWVVLTILKNMKIDGKDDIPYIMENKIMFQTTNQICIIL